MVLLGHRSKRRAAAFAPLRPRIVTSLASLRETVAHPPKDSLWISYAGDLTDALVKHGANLPSKLGAGIFVHALDVKTIPVLSSLFRRIAFAADGGFLPAEELAEVLNAENRADLFIGGFTNRATETVTLWRGNLEPLTVPFAAFEPSGDGTKPDFTALSVTDGGQTVQLGSYEAVADVLLYEYDPTFRRAMTKQRHREEQSFGASLRRLRKQRGLRREDFEPALTAKTIARIEQGKVSRIQKATAEALAQRLGVAAEELGTY